MTLLHILEFEIFIFCETDYQLSCCQVSNPSVIWIKFYRGWYIKTPKSDYDVIMTSLQNICFSKLHILQNLIENINLPNFIGLGYLDQILRGLVENISPPPQIYTLSKSSVFIGLIQRGPAVKEVHFKKARHWTFWKVSFHRKKLGSKQTHFHTFILVKIIR